MARFRYALESFFNDLTNDRFSNSEIGLWERGLDGPIRLEQTTTIEWQARMADGKLVECPVP